MAVWNVAPYKFNITGNDTLLSPWREVTALTPRENHHWTIAALPNYAVQQVGFVDMGLHNPMANAIDEDRLTLAENGTFVLNIRGVAHIDAAPDKTVNLEVVGRDGFTTDGSFNSVTVRVGNHEIFYTGATRDSTLFTGSGWDQVRLIDHPGVNGTQYWAVVRRADGEVDAYSLYSGYRIRMEDGGTTWGNVNGRINYGEVDEIYLASRNRPAGDMFNPGQNIANTGDRGSFDNIDLSDGNNPAAYTDRFIAASFKSIHYATQNVHVGTAIVETFNGDTTGGTQSASRDHITTNGNHHLIVDEEAVAIDGHLRLYVRDNNSGLYNRFNEVYLGTSAAEINSNDYSTTSRNAYATNQGTGQGATPVLGTALYGFGGNDVLTGGADVDYLFGGTSTFTTIPVAPDSGLPGNILTGGDGGDYFGVGNVSMGLDGDAIMTTDFTARLSGASPLSNERSGLLSQLNLDGPVVVRTADSSDLATRVATDRITDWTAGTDYLRVLANGTAIVEGLGTANGLGAGGYAANLIDNDAELIDLSGNQVLNQGKIVARGLGGVDTLVGSTGSDWLYGNADGNHYDISQGGNDRIYVDQFDGSRSKHYVQGFTKSGTAANADLVMLNKRVIDAFDAAGSARTGLTADVNAEYVQAQAYNPGVNFLHDPFYNPSIAAPNSTHTSQDGRGLFAVPIAPSGSDGTSGYIGLGMTIAGRALLAVPFVGPIIGGALIATGTLLGGAGNVVQTTPHQNATYSGNVGAYLNVLTDVATNNLDGRMERPDSTVGNVDAGIRFLDFFQNSDAGDGYIPVVEFTASAGTGIYGYFALHSDDETFVYLVASRDHLVENAEALLVAQIDGQLSAADFAIYDGEVDIYNYGVLPAVVLRDPAISTVTDSGNPADPGETDGRIDNATNPIVVTGTVNGTLSAGSFFRVYDGATKIYDGAVPVAGQLVTASVNGSNFQFTDSRALGTTVRNTTNSAPTGANITGDDTFVLTDARVLYTVELVDGETGIPTRVSARDITISGGNAVIDGGDGADLLLLTETSTYLNGVPDGRLTGFETISLSGTADSNSVPTPINLNLSLQSEGFDIISGSAGDTIVGSSGVDEIFGLGGADSIDAGSNNDVVVYSTEFVADANGDPTNAVDRTAAQQLIEDATVIGGPGIDTLRFDTDRVVNGVVQTNPAVVLVDADFAKVTQFEVLDLNGTGAQSVTLAGNANSAFANGITVNVEPTATSLNFNASNANWTHDVWVSGTNNNDTIIGGSGDDTLLGGLGNDNIQGGAGANTITGGAGADTITLTADASHDLLVMSMSDGGAYGANSGWDVISNFNGNGAFTDLVEITGWTDRSSGTFVDQNNVTVDDTNLGYLTSTMGRNSGVVDETELLVVTDSAVTSISDVKAAIDSAYDLTNLNDGPVLFSVKGANANEWWFGVYNDVGANDTTDLSEFKVLGKVTVSGGGFDFDDFWQPGVLLNLPPEVNARAVENGVEVTSNEDGTVNIGGVQVTNPNITAGGTVIIGEQAAVRSGIASVTDLLGATGDALGEAGWLPANTIYGLGTSGADTFTGNYAWGFGGNDTLNGTSGTDFLYGGSGDDVFNPGAGADHIYTGGGSETVNLTVDGATDRIYFSTATAAQISGAGTPVPVGTFFQFSTASPAAGGDLLVMSGVAAGNRQILLEANPVGNPYVQDDLQAAFSGKYGANVQAVLIMQDGSDAYIYFWSDAGSGDMTPADDVWLLGIVAGVTDVNLLADNIAFL